YESKDISFDEWIMLLTLCLAPLIAHLVAGVPTPTYLQAKRPSWHERTGLFNPTSVIWRYFSIMDRRARSWNPLELAASNAVFWTNKGWNGSEEMIEESSNYHLRLPAKTHIDLISGTAAKTLIVTLQGVQSIYTLTMGMAHPGSNNYGYSVSIQSVFLPLAIFGLFRLPVACWLAEDYSFANFDMLNLSCAQRASLELKQTTRAIESLLPAREDTFLPTKSIQGILVRTTCITVLIIFWGFAAYYIIPFQGTTNDFSVTTLLIDIFYLFFLTVTIAVLSYYFWHGSSRSTIILCMSHMWYKVYTLSLFAFIIVIITIAALETRKTPCGTYTSYSKADDGKLCPRLCNALPSLCTG
ncbi:hypothetical protein NA57DRAFT_48585, partial [Rhizodiscina lignyota]